MYGKNGSIISNSGTDRLVHWHGTTPEENGQARICVDLTQLNESVKRELHPLLVVEHVLAQLAEAKVFSKLHANQNSTKYPWTPDRLN